MALLKMAERGAIPGAGSGAVERVSATSPPAALDLLRAGDVDYACLPTESSLEGGVPATLDALGAHDELQIYAETVLHVAFTLALAPGVDAADVRTVGAYPVAAAQVRAALAEYLPDAVVVPSSSNAAAALDAVAGRVDAAVTTALAAEQAGLTTLAAGVADADDAHTRFVLVGRVGTPPPRTGKDRTALVLNLPDEPGSLVAAMGEFAMRGIDLVRIESRPARSKQVAGRYHFFLEAIGHVEDDAVAEALAALYRRADRVHFLGSWPRVTATGAPPPDHGASRAWLAGIRGENS